MHAANSVAQATNTNIHESKERGSTHIIIQKKLLKNALVVKRVNK